MQSLPAGERGLKQFYTNLIQEMEEVAPRRGAWIET